ncbi:MAG: CPBP family intramembrane glutamic endopeptidase [Acidithiobacillus sp.]|jgi:membrane protease YdiL (CAAX protease family)|uniref:CPBP family intramembrane glutamic endopeptidase n=1 Tax=Acidithiobacillus sp. TaxID=1872118 RepID=UPI00355D3C0D
MVNNNIKLDEIKLTSIGKGVESVYSTYSKSFQKELESKRRISRGVLYCKYNIEKEEYRISYISIFLWLAAIVLCMYLLIKYTSADKYDDDVLPFIIQICITLAFLFFGIIIHISFVNHSLKIEELNWNTMFGVFMGIAIGAMTLLFQGFIKGIRYSVIAEDYLMFFLAVSIAEESFWRFGIQPTIRIILNFTINKTVEDVNEQGEVILTKIQNETATRILSITLSVIVTSVLFMLFHIFVYESLSELFIIFIMGVIFGLSFEVTKRLDTPMIAHLIVNFIAGIGLITVYFGGL